MATLVWVQGRAGKFTKLQKYRKNLKKKTILRYGLKAQNGWEAKMNEKQTKLIESITSTKRPMFTRAFQGNRPAAVKAKCFECCGFNQDEAANCEIMTCPLIEVNPYRKSRIKRCAKIES